MLTHNAINYFDIMGKAKKSYARRMEPICSRWGLTQNELDVILFLHNNPDFDRAVDIVERRGIAKSHVSLSVNALEGKGLLRRRFSPEDRRTAHLELTETGIQIARDGQKAQKAYFDRIFADLTPEEFAAWRAIMEKVCCNIANLED